jgi:hypothetical protein
LSEHGVHAALVTEVELAPYKTAEPLSLSPDVWFGVTPRLTVGVIHSNLSVDHMVAGASLCVQQSDIGCHRFYHGSGADVLYGLGPHVAPRARLLVRDTDPFKPAATVGALVQATHGRFAVAADPYLQIGLANTRDGNRAQLFVPVAFIVQPTCRWAVDVRTGYDSELVNARDGWHMPLGLGARARVTSYIDVYALGAFTSPLGPQNTWKRRVMFLTIEYRSR